MLDVNNLNTAVAVTNLIDNVNRQNNINNESLLWFAPATSSVPPGTDTNSSVLLSDFLVNTTAAVVDYAAQWLTTTIATTASNLTSVNNATFNPVYYPLSSTDSGLNYTSQSSFVSSYFNFTIPPSSEMAKSTISSGNNQTTTNRTSSPSPSPSPSPLPSLRTTTTSLSLSPLPSSTSTAPTLMLNTNLMGENPKFDDGGTNNEGWSDCHPNNPNFNCSRMDYIFSILGPQTLPLYTSLIITILYGGIFITGFLGNVLVCVVIVKHTAMHTATNYYLFNLAVSDLIYLIFGLPTEVFAYWHQYPYLFGLPFCKARAYISEASTYVSVLTIVAFSVERYLAICHPLHKYALSGFKRALRIIALLWVVSFIGAIPFVIWTKINYWDYPPDQSQITESGFCGTVTPTNIPLFEVSSLVFFFIPMFLIFYFYGRMGAKIYSRTTQKLGVQKGSMHRESRHQQSRKAVIRMLAAVVLTFFICWLPFHLQRLWTVHGKKHKYYEDVNEWLFKITGFAYYVTCTINPILYNVMSHRYRVAFKDILCGKRQNVYSHNGFSRDQSSFRETTVATSLYNSTYDRMHSVRVRSIRIANNIKDRNSINSNNILWKKSDFNMPKEKDMPENHSTKYGGTNAVVVCVDNGVKGRTQVFTENEAHESLLSKNNETCI